MATCKWVLFLWFVNEPVITSQYITAVASSNIAQPSKILRKKIIGFWKVTIFLCYIKQYDDNSRLLFTKRDKLVRMGVRTIRTRQVLSRCMYFKIT